ncbi:hypothetical protein TNCV_3817911 [Trichonephila clavipes]|nr:hypothetical protein TNCV_3817911 [Trichonephila clavipes]
MAREELNETKDINHDGEIKLITEAASFNASLIQSSDFEKPIALADSWEVEYLVPLIINKSSYTTPPFVSCKDSIPGNQCDIFLREFAIMYLRKCIGDFFSNEAHGCQISAYDSCEIVVTNLTCYLERCHCCHSLTVKHHIRCTLPTIVRLPVWWFFYYCTHSGLTVKHHIRCTLPTIVRLPVWWFFYYCTHSGLTVKHHIWCTLLTIVRLPVW